MGGLESIDRRRKKRNNYFLLIIFFSETKGEQAAIKNGDKDPK